MYVRVRMQTFPPLLFGPGVILMFEDFVRVFLVGKEPYPSAQRKRTAV